MSRPSSAGAAHTNGSTSTSTSTSSTRSTPPSPTPSTRSVGSNASSTYTSTPGRSGSFNKKNVGSVISPPGSPKRTSGSRVSLDPPTLSPSPTDGQPDGEVMPGIKLLLLGDSGVGKSSLMCRFADDEFMTNMTSTAGVDFKIKVVRLETGQKVRLRIWDTAGQERFKTITRQYYRGAMGIVLVYDVTDEKSFEHVRYWMSNIQQYASRDVVLVLVANKIDMEESLHRVSRERARELASEYGIPLVETSAKQGQRVDEVFLTMASLVMTRMDLFSPTQSVPLDDKSKSNGFLACCK